MSEKLSQPQANALRHLAKHGPITNQMATRKTPRYPTACTLVALGLAVWVRNGYITNYGRQSTRRYERDWEITITDKGRALVSQWEAAERWFKMTGAAK